ncbi:hypothetical protein [Pseudoblastomonas halimionae]|uniref:Uncharacterized protein n=1 Tax=Alteriqipengyuania halimionae TaxID=1926630 RepID=A0A6I4U801_9SPHN|nr:hypothetical protein [Alteriqipengyuania halimionae]MXP11023.1 hypothetical protein [Alteriqipengyuania halimionae]
MSRSLLSARRSDPALVARLTRKARAIAQARRASHGSPRALWPLFTGDT